MPINPFDQFDSSAAGSGNPFDQFDGPSLAKPPEAPSFTGAMAKGFKRSLPETKSLLAGAGAAVAGAVGLDGVRDKLLDTYQGIQQSEVAPLQAKTGFIDAVTGDGSLKEWAGDTLGNFGGQALQSVAAAGAGALVGSAVPGAGTVAGGVGGLLFKAGAKEMVTDAVGRMVAKGVAKDVAEKTALRRLGGAAIAGTGLNVGQEIGTGYTGRAEDAKQSGEQLTQADALRAIGYGIPAGLVDTAAEALTGSRLMRGVSDSPKILSRMAKGAGIGAVSEGGTEGVQAVLERAGANQALTGDAAYRDYIENIAAGALGGGVAGAGGGFRRQEDPAAPPPPETKQQQVPPEVNASQAVQPAPSPLATPPAGPLTRAAATVPGAAPLATPPADVAGATAQTPTDALPPLIADTAAQAVAAPPAADPVFEQAKQLLGAAGKVNRKQLRADLGIKENQMQTLLDQLHAAGIIGPSNGNKARKLLVNPLTGAVVDPDEQARLDRKVERDAQQKALEEAARGGKPAAAIEAAAAAQGQQPAPTLSRPPMKPEFEAKMRERQTAALTRAPRPDPAAGATSAAAAVAFDTGAAALAEQQNAQAAQEQQAQAAVAAQAEADKAQQQQQKVAEKAAKEADKAARQADKDSRQAEKDAQAAALQTTDEDIRATVQAEIDAGKPMDGMRMSALAAKLKVTPKRIDQMRMAIAQGRKASEQARTSQAGSPLPTKSPSLAEAPSSEPASQAQDQTQTRSADSGLLEQVQTQLQVAPVETQSEETAAYTDSSSASSYDTSADVLDDDITPPSGGPFTIRSAAESAAKRNPGARVVEVDGGFVARTPRSVVAQAATTSPDPGLEDALRQERDAYTNERDDAYLNKTKHARDPVKDAIEDALNASVLDPDAARVVLDVALSNSRVDLAEYAVSRAERSVAGMSITPGVPQNSPKYADIKAALESRKREATALLDSLKKDLAVAKAATVKESLTVAAAKPKEAIATDVAGEQLDDKWTAFAPETGTLNVPRSDMPQVKSVHRGAMVQYLAARGITHEQAEVPADSLKPTQAEFSAGKVKKALKRAAEGEDRAILVSADGHVLDGHHQWLAKREAGAPVKVIRLNAPIAELLQQVKEFPSSTQAKGATAPVEGATPTKPNQTAQEPTNAEQTQRTEQAPAPRQAAEEAKPEALLSEKAPSPRSHAKSLARVLRDEADKLWAAATDNGRRAVDAKWIKSAIKRVIIDDKANPYLVGKQYEAIASAKIALSKASTLDDVRKIADKLEASEEKQAAEAAKPEALLSLQHGINRVVVRSSDWFDQSIQQLRTYTKFGKPSQGYAKREHLTGPAEAFKPALLDEPAAEPAKPSSTMARQRMPRSDAVAEVQRQLKVTKQRATEIVNEIRSEAKNLDGVTYNLKPGIVQTADVQAAIERERAAQAKQAPAAIATHKDPGQPAEPVTAPVIADAIKTSAAKTPLNLKEARAWLLERVDEALKGAPKSGANVTVSDPRTEDGRKVRDVSTDVVDPVSGASRPRLRVVEIKVADSGSTYNIMHGNKVLDRQDGSLRFAILTAENLLLASKWQPTGGPAGSWDFTGSAPADFVTFDVPGDGKFKVLNTRENLEAFRAKVVASSGFKDERKRTAAAPMAKSEAWTVINDFLEDDEFGNIYTYANAVDKPLRFGVGGDDTVTAYAVAEDIAIADGIETFIGRAAFKATIKPQTGRKEKPIPLRGTWAVIEVTTGLSLGGNHPTRDAAITSAKKNVAHAGVAKTKEMLKESIKRKNRTEKQREQDWLKAAAPDVYALMNGQAEQEAAPVAKAAKPQQQAVQPAPAQPQDENAKPAKANEVDARYEHLLSLKSTRLMDRHSDGRALYEVTLSMEQRKALQDSGGQFIRSASFEIKSKEEVTGKRYDTGYVLIDRREQNANRAAAAAKAIDKKAVTAQVVEEAVKTATFNHRDETSSSVVRHTKMVASKLTAAGVPAWAVDRAIEAGKKAADARDGKLHRVSAPPILDWLQRNGFIREETTTPTLAEAKKDEPLTEWALQGFIKIAADSVQSLRPVDVERVIRETPTQHRQAVAEYIKKNSYGALDLEVDDVARELGVTMTPVAPDLKGFKLEQTDSAAFDLVDGNMRVSVVPMADGKFQASYRGAKSSPHLQSKQAAIDWAAGYRDEAKRLAAPASSVQGQKNMAARGGRIATLMAMNGRLRKLDPDSAWLDSNIEQADDLDALQDQISEALTKAERGKQPTNALRSELEQMSGAELRVVFDRMSLAGARMTHIERVEALMAEDEAEVRAAMAAVQPEATTGPADAKGERKFYVTMIRDSKVARIAGPFDTKEEADAILPAARDKAKEVDPRAVFDAFGVSAVTMEEHKPAALNEQLGIGKAAPPEFKGGMMVRLAGAGLQGGKRYELFRDGRDSFGMRDESGAAKAKRYTSAELSALAARGQLTVEQPQAAKAQEEKAATPAIPEGYKPTGEPYYVGKDLVQGYAKFPQGERVKLASGIQGVVTGHIGKGPILTRAMVKFDNGTESGVDERELVAVAAAKQDDDAPTMSRPEARELMFWQDMGQKDGEKSHRLTFYTSKDDAESKRGSMTYGKITKDQGSSKWFVEDGDSFTSLADAKRQATEMALDRAEREGFIAKDAPAKQEASAKAPATPPQAADFPDAASYHAAVAAYRAANPATPAAPKQDRRAEIRRELAALQQNYEKRMNRADGAVPPAIKADALAGIARKMDKLTAELKALDEAKATPAKPGAITDFGEKLPPARRAMAAKLDEALTDADIANRPLSEIWPEASAEKVAVEAAVESVLTPAEKSDAATELGLEQWGEPASSAFYARMMDFAVSGVEASRRLAAMFTKVLKSVGRTLLTALAVFSMTTVTVDQNQVQAIPIQVVAQQVQRAPAAEFGMIVPSTDARRMADWIVAKGDNLGNNFVVADKVEGRLYFFSPNGTLTNSTPALFGRTPGDIAPEYRKNMTMEQIRQAQQYQITPAGRFETATDKSRAYGEVVPIAKTGKNSRVAIHKVYTGRPAEKRMERLSRDGAFENDPLAARISLGCINVDPAASAYSNDFFRDGGVVYVMPETEAGKTVFEGFATALAPAAERTASFAKSDKPNAPGARGMPTDKLTRLLATAKQAMALLGVNIEVVANGSDLPAEITGQDDYDDTVQAAITGDRKTVYFVASRIKSPRDAIKLVAHELVGHMSMEQLLGKRWPELRDAILRLRDNGKWPEVFAEVSKRYERNADGTFRALDDATFAAEAIAVFAERNIQTSILQRAVNGVRAWLRRLGFAMDMSQGELRQMLWEAGQKLEGRAYRPGVVDDVLGAKPEPKQMSMREAVQREAVQRYSFSRTTDRDPFYSALLRSIEEAKGAPKKADGAAWRQWLDGAQRRGEIKQSEREWVGVDAWLDGQQEPVTREALAEFVRANAVQVREVVLEENDEFDGATRAPRTGAKFASYQLPGGKNYRELLLTMPAKTEGTGWKLVDHSLRDLGIDSWRVYMPNGRPLPNQRGDMTQAQAETAMRQAQASSTGSDNANYRSSHFDQPNILAHVRFNERVDADGKRVLFIEEVQSDWHQAGRKHGYKSSKPEVFAKARAEDFIVVKKSNQHRDYEWFEAAHKDMPNAPAGTGKTEAEAVAEAMKVWDKSLNARARDEAGMVPDAPIKKEWPLTAMKRMIRWAAENGFDRIAWTTGDQQAERYDLSKQVDTIVWRKNSDGSVAITALKNGRDLAAGDHKPAALPDVVGKELADRILESKQASGEYSGVDLKVGGEGMRAFYDKMLPSELAKYVKRWGGKVGTTQIGAKIQDDQITWRVAEVGGYSVIEQKDGVLQTYHIESDEDFADTLGHELSSMVMEAVAAGQESGVITDTQARASVGLGPAPGKEKPVGTVPSIDITTAMRQAAMEGQALFSKAGTIVDRLQEAINPKDTTLLQRLKDKLSDWRPAALGALQLRHLGELAERILPPVAMYSGVVQRMATMRNELQELGHSVVEAGMKYQGANPKESKKLFRMLHDATLAGVDPSGDHKPLRMMAADYKTNVDVTDESVRKFVKLMNEQAKLNPGSAVSYVNRAKEARKLLSQERKRRVSHKELAPAFAQLSADGKALWAQMRDAYAAQSDEYQKALISRIESLSFDKAKKAGQIARMRLQFESARVPFYVPLARWGEYWVSGTNSDGQREFFMQESQADQARVRKELAKAGYLDIGHGVKLDTVKAQDGASASFMADMDEMLADSGAPEKIRDEAFQLYLRSLPDLSMRKNFIHRQGTPGFSQDAVRALAGHIFHGSFQIARLRYSHELQALLTDAESMAKDMGKAGDDDANAAGNIVNELKKRHEWVMNPQDNALVNKISSIGFVYYLGLTPAAALVNLLQTPMVALPILAGKHKLGAATRELTRAMRDSLGTYGNMQTKLEGEELEAHKEFARRGVFDKSQAHNMAGISESDTHAYSPKWHKAMTVISHVFHKAEVVNREATAMAAYRLERAAGAGHVEAVEAADRAVHESQFDYSNANRARFMQSGTAKVLLMFRQYSLAVTWLLGRNMYQAFKGEDAATKKEAQRKLAGILGMTAIFSGTLGLPIIGTVGAVLNAVAAAFGDDDEPWDWETEFRAFLREMLGETGAEAVLRGPVQAATGIGIASRVSMGDLWFREPDRELEGRAWSNYLFEQAAGPMGGLVTNFFRAQQLMGEGHVWRGVETMMPKAIKDAMKSVRYLDEGVNNMRGDPIVEDLNVFESLAQIAGFAPASVANAYDTARDVKNYEQAILNRRSRLMDAFALAWRLGDVDAREAVLAKMRKFSQTYPELAITSDSIRRSLMQRAKASTQAENGVIIDKRIRARLEGQMGMAP